jgi:methionyl aminopeptidase
LSFERHFEVADALVYRQLLQFINRQYGTLAFCRKWLDQEGQSRHLIALKSLVDAGIVRAHPPLVDIKVRL